MKVLKYVDVEIDGVNPKDYPDFVDTYVASATAVLEDGSTREATEAECEELSNDGDLMNQLAHESFI
mgnify:CR=1 FL=1